MTSPIPALGIIATLALAFLWAGWKRAAIGKERIVEPEPCSDYDGEGHRG